MLLHGLRRGLSLSSANLQICMAVLLCAAQPLVAEETVIGENEIIEGLSKIDPEIAAAKFRINEADARQTRARSTYYPTIELQVLEPVPGSFPGSLGHSRIDGLMVSPYHTGFSAGFAATYTLFDFGRTSNRVREAEQDKVTADFDAKIARVEAVQRGLNTFYTAIKFRELGKLWAQKERDLKGLEREIIHFVQTGQKSIVDRHLVRSHVESVQREKLEFENRYDSGLKILASLLEMTATDTQLVPLNKIQIAEQSVKTDELQSPYVQRVRSEKLAAEHGLKRAESEHYPELRAFGSAGYMEGSRIVPTQNWAAGFAASLPLFQGFKVKAEVNEAQSRVLRIEKQLEAATKRIHETNLKLDQEIRTAQEEIRMLDSELRTAEAGYLSAKVRYRNFQGNLTDLRETIVTYYRTLGGQVDARLKLAYLLKVQALTNGGL